jgi:hypothetical protein
MRHSRLHLLPSLISSHLPTCGAGYLFPQPYNYIFHLVILCLRQPLACATCYPFGVHFYLLGHALFYENVRSQGLVVRKRSMKSQYPIMTRRVTIRSSSMKHSVAHTRPKSNWALGELRPFGSAKTISMPRLTRSIQSSPFRCTDAPQECIQSPQNWQGRCTS